MRRGKWSVVSKPVNDELWDKFVQLYKAQLEFLLGGLRTA